MLLSNNNATIIIESIDNIPKHTSSNYIYDFNNYKNDELHNILHVKIIIGDSVSSIYLFCDFCGCFESCTVLNEDKLYIIKFNTLYEIDIVTNQIRYVVFNDLAGAMGPYKTIDGLIIHGEMEIVKLDFDLNEIWHFCGADIFVSLTDKPAITIYDDKIELVDFENNHYIISHDGNEIK